MSGSFAPNIDTENEGSFYYASNYGVKADLEYVQPTYNTATIVSGTDTTAQLQALLNLVGSTVPNDVELAYEGCPRVITPHGKMILSSTLLIPPNVLLACEHTVFFNFLSDDWEPAISGSRHSHATKIKLFGNNKSGIQWGDPNAGGVRSDSYIDSVWVEHCGVDFQASLPANQQKCGLRLYGLWYRINRIEVKEANIGVDLYQASDVMCPAVFPIGCSTAIRCESAEQISFPSVCLDTNIQTGIQIDNSNNITMTVQAFVNSDGYGTAMDCLLKIGTYSGNPCRGIFINAIALSTGGRMLEIEKAMDCEFRLYASNARLYSQTSGGGTATSHWSPTVTGALLAHDMGTNYQPYGNEGEPTALVKYGSNFAGFLNIELWKPVGVTATEGIQYGNIEVNGA